MARSCNGTTNQQISGDLGGLVASSTSATIAGWVRRGATGSRQAFGFMDTGGRRFGTTWFSDNNIYFVVETTGTGGGYVASTATGWHHIAGVFDGTASGNANRCRIFLNGVQQTLIFYGSAIPASLHSSPGTYRVNRDIPNSTWGAGDYAELGMWAAALTDDECAALAKRCSPRLIRPSSLVSYIPMIRDVIDVRSGIALTESLTSVADHPPIIP